MNSQPVEKVRESNGMALDIVKIWPTIQGEGPFAGTPAIFIRTAGCTHQCPLCFGVDEKSRIPYLSMSYGGKKRLDKIEHGDVLLTYNEDFNIVETNVTNIIERKVTTWFELTTDDGQTYDVTPEHPFMTPRGIVAMKDLVVGDDIYEVSYGDIIAYKKYGDRNPMKDIEVVKKSRGNMDYVSMAKKISQTVKRKKKRGLYKTPWSLMTEQQKKDWSQKVRKSKLGKLNPNWKGIKEQTKNFDRLKELIKQGKKKYCRGCQKRGCKLLVHHIDENRENDKISNLLILCHSCHNKIHKRGYNFWNGERRDGKQLVTALSHNGRKVVHIISKTGKLKVRNLSCSPYNTYFANRMWVHNCDTDYTANRNIVRVEEIVQAVVNLKRTIAARVIVITGGEPFRQNISQLVIQLRQFVPFVQIETNGAVAPQDWPTTIDIPVVISPKAGVLHPYWINNPQRIWAMKYVIRAGYVDLSDGLPSEVLGYRYRPARATKISPSDIYLQPADEGDSETNQNNMEAALASCKKYGYNMGTQLHKIWGLE